MKKLRESAVLLLIGLFVFFNIERLDLGQENIVDLSSFIYVLGVIATIVTVMMPLLHRTHRVVILGLWLVVYLLVKVILGYYVHGRPFWGGVYTYLSITEIVFLLLIVSLAYQFSFALRDFEEAVERITFSETHHKRIRQFHEAQEEIQVEMFRSRHNHHPLSVIVVEPEAGSVQAAMNRMVQEIQRAMMNSYVVNNMARTLSKYLRQTDLVLEQREQGRFIVLCPETTTGDLQLLVEYIHTLTAEQLGITVTCGAATFPNEAITFEELVRTAESHLSANGHEPIRS